MPGTILKTKLHIPPARPGLVARPQLIERLNAGLEGKLTLLSAPAGFGKTTLLIEWITGSKRPFAWVSLDAGDNDPVRFLTYFIAAIQKISPNTGSGVLSSLQSTQPGFGRAPSESLLTMLVNDLSEIPAPFMIVLDDYHTITEKSVQGILIFILENQPAHMHLVISGRVDPPWPLARLRAHAAVNELRSADLRFTPSEAEIFLNERMALQLSPEAVETLAECTEGWIAGLQMAALSMQGRDTTEFIKAFTGSQRFISDFLLEEVLARQPQPTQEFLLKTSILERICAPLADAVLSDGTIKEPFASQAMLESLERSNLFLIPMDEEAHWYRYHHLFRDLLRSNLESLFPGETPNLHRKASQWFANAHLFDEAIEHAFASREHEWTAGLIEQAAPQIDIQNKLVVINSWIDRLPDELVEERPWLCVYRAWGQHWTGQREEVALTLLAAERALEIKHQGRESEDSYLSDEADRHINGHIAAIRAHSALTHEEIPRVLVLGEKALALLPKGDEMRCETGVALGGAYWALGDVVKAERAFDAARADALLCGYPSMAVPASCYVGMQQTKQARLVEAMATYRDGLRMATTADGKELPVAGFPNTRLGDLLRERNELEAARSHLQRGVEQCVQLGQADVLTDGYACLARLQIALGDLAAAQESLNKALAVVQKTKVDPFVMCWLEECRIRFWLGQGNLDDAAQWAEKSGLQVDGELSYHYDLHHINLARVLVALGPARRSLPALNQAIELLDRLQEAATHAGWVNETIKILILKALALPASGNPEGAQAELVQALRLAEPGGYLRTFVDEGAPMQALLEGCRTRLASNPRLTAYIDRLLTAFTAPQPESPSRTEAVEKRGPRVQGAGLVEQLTERELDVLRLLNAGLTSNEIAVELYLSVHTVRTHIKSIYGKLNASRRIEAIDRARELNLI